MDLVDGDWIIDWSHNKRIGYPENAIISDHFLNFYVLFDDGVTTLGFYSDVSNFTYTNAEQIADFGGAVASWSSVTIYGNNDYTGLGEAAALSVVTGDKLLFEDASGYLEFEDGTGVLLLE